jgi:hypothetical protein
MKVDTVLLSLVRYHALQEAEKKANEPNKHTVYVKRYYGYSTCYPTGNTTSDSETLFTNDAAVAELGNELKAALEKAGNLQNEVIRYKMLYPEEQQITIDVVKKMSVFQFLKWKRKNK